MLYPVFSLSLAYDIQLSLVIEIESLARQTIKVNFENTGTVSLLTSLFVIANKDLEVDLLWLPSHVPEILFAIFWYRLDLAIFASCAQGNSDIIESIFFIIFIAANCRLVRWLIFLSDDMLSWLVLGFFKPFKL